MHRIQLYVINILCKRNSLINIDLKNDKENLNYTNRKGQIPQR